MEIYVSFSDATEDKIVASFSCPQDPDVWPNQGTVDSADERWTSYAALFPSGTFNFLKG